MYHVKQDHLYLLGGYVYDLENLVRLYLCEIRSVRANQSGRAADLLRTRKNMKFSTIAFDSFCTTLKRKYMVDTINLPIE